MSCNCEHIKWGTLLCALLDVKFSVASTQSWVKRVDWFFNHICSERVWSREGWAKVAQQTNVSTMLHWQLFFPFFFMIGCHTILESKSQHLQGQWLTQNPPAGAWQNCWTVTNGHLSFLPCRCRSHVVTHTYFSLFGLHLMAQKGQSSHVIHF